MKEPQLSDELKQRMVNFFIEKGVFQQIYEEKKRGETNENQSKRMETAIR